MLFSLIGASVFLSQITFFSLLFLIFAGIAVLLASKAGTKLLEPLLSHSSLGRKLSDAFSAMNMLSVKIILVSICYTLVMFLVILLQCYTLVKTFYYEPLSFEVILFVFPLVILAQILPVTIGGLGIREGVAIYCLSLFGVPSQVSVTATLHLFLINLVFPALLGCVIILRSSRLPKRVD